MTKIRSFFKKLLDCTPIWCRIALGVGAVSALLYIGFLVSVGFSDFYTRYIGSFFRGTLALISSIVPFSIAETAIMLLPLILVLAIIWIVKVSKGTIKDMVRALISMFCVLTLFLSSFSLLFASGYRGSSLDKKLGLQRKNVSGVELYDTATYLHTQMAPLVNKLTFKANGDSVMPHSFFEMNALLQKAYVKAAKKYDFLPTFKSTVKPIILSEPMTYTHISGVYTYFTGESNVNTNFPDYTLPYTAAHELAHQRGIAREDEANFVAFLVCIESDDPYIKYSGYMSVYEYVLNALYRADKNLYKKALNNCNNFLYGEMVAYNLFFKKYEDNVVADVSTSVNNGYLQSQGQSAGSRSYGMVVDLAVAYYKDLIKK
jgi:hypothetical protein